MKTKAENVQENFEKKKNISKWKISEKFQEMCWNFSKFVEKTVLIRKIVRFLGF